MIAIVLATVLAIFASIFTAGQMRDILNDNAAVATGRYLLQVRGAVVDLQVRYQPWLAGHPNAGNSEDGPAPSELSWKSIGGAEVAQGGVSDLVSLGLLPANTPKFPALGDTVRFALVREGDCPGEDCRSTAFVYTCHPISAERSRKQLGECTTPTADRAGYSPPLLAKVLLATDGFGGHDARGGKSVEGPLLKPPRAWFDFDPAPGHAVVAAGLDATPFGQFVRHGETRPVKLNNTLTVEQTIQTNRGLLLNTAVTPGATCSPEGLYASTTDKMLAVCVNGAWFAAMGHVVTGVYANLPNNATIPTLTCPAGLKAWRHIAMQDLDVTVTGSDVKVAGAVSGSIQGGGSVNAAGSVTVNGAFNGTFENAGSSYVRAAQSVAIVDGRVAIIPNGSNARAAVLQGCKS